MSTNRVVIRPFVEPVPNMGLEKYNQALFDGAKYTIEMAAIEEGDTVRYLTGINPFSADVEFMDDTAKEAKIEEIKKIAIYAEGKLAGVRIKEDDVEWWSKIKKVRPDNIAFWSSPDMKLVLGNDEYILDTKKNVKDLLIYTSIKAGGFPEIAVSLEKARLRSVRPKFYLDELEETASSETEVLKLRDEAGELLKGLYTSNPIKFMYVAKVVDANSMQYKKSTPLDVLYLNMSKYLNGKSFEKNERKAASFFIEIASLDMETLKLRAIVKDSTSYKFIAIKGDGMIYDMDSASAMGKNPTQVVEFLKNPLNEEIFKRLMGKIEVYWKQ